MKLEKSTVDKLKNATSVEELIVLAKEEGIELPKEEAEKVFAELPKKPGLMDDKELENVSGGSTNYKGRTYSDDPPYELITTYWNMIDCGKYGQEDCYRQDPNCTDFWGEICGTCARCHSGGFLGMTLYCSFRTKDNDPFR